MDLSNCKSKSASNLPLNWHEKELGNLIDLLTGFAFQSNKFSGSGTKLLRGSNVKRNEIDWNPEITRYWEGETNDLHRFKLREGDIVIALDGALIGRSFAKISSKDIPCYLVQRVARIRGKDIDQNFLHTLFSEKRFQLYVDSVKTHTAIPHISPTDIRNYQIILPPIGEQKKIAEILSTWDKSIETTEKLIAAKQKLKKSLMQRLLTGAQRFPEFHGQEQKHKYLGEVALESTERNKNSMTSEKLMAVMKSAGMIPMRERVQSENVSRCKIVAPKWFAYNPMRLNIGSIAQWNGDETVMVSGDYVVFKCNESLLDPDYLNHFRKSYGWTNFVKNSGDGSVRIRIYFSHLADLKILLPPLEEQKKIATVLNTSDAEINILQSKLHALRQQKRGLMQKLLTGRVRVEVDE